MSSKEETGIEMEKVKILVVDDEVRIRKLVHDFLIKKGYEVLEAGDGDEALEIFYQEKNISLIILDISLIIFLMLIVNIICATLLIGAF